MLLSGHDCNALYRAGSNGRGSWLARGYAGPGLIRLCFTRFRRTELGEQLRKHLPKSRESESESSSRRLRCVRAIFGFSELDLDWSRSDYAGGVSTGVESCAIGKW